MSAEHWDLDQDNTLGGNNPSPNKSSSQKAIKEYVDSHSGGGTITVDNKSITKNTSDELQTVGVINQNDNTTSISYWSGTRAEYEAMVANLGHPPVNVTCDITDDNDMTLTLLEAIYGVGAIYIGTMSVCPMAVLMPNTVWELKAQDMVLQGAGTKGIVKTELPQNVKLPKISGSVGSNAGRAQYTGPSGCFTVSNGTSYYAMGGPETSGTSFTFDSSRSSSIYSGDGTNTEIQQPAYLVNIWERVA